MVFHSARKVSYGAVKVSHGARKVSTDYCLLSESFSLQESAVASKNKTAAQAAGQTLPAEAPPISKIHPFSKMTVTFDPFMGV